MSKSSRMAGKESQGMSSLDETDRHLLLSVARRRITIDILANGTAPIYLDDLAAAVADRETDAAMASNETVERVAVSLHHSHLPMMDDFGLIEYDRESTRVESCAATPTREWGTG